MSLNELRDAWRANDWGDAAMDTKKAAPRAPHPDRSRKRRWDLILNALPEDVLCRTLGLLLFESSDAPTDEDGVKAPPPPLLPQSPAAAGKGGNGDATLRKSFDLSSLPSQRHEQPQPSSSLESKSLTLGQAAGAAGRRPIQDV